MSLLDFAKEHITLFIPDHEPNMLYDYEIEVLTHINDNKLSTILKSRQVGMSSLYAVYVVWLCICQPFVINSITLINGYSSVREILLNFIRKWDNNSRNCNLGFKSNAILFYGIRIYFIQGRDMDLFINNSNVIIIDEAVDLDNNELVKMMDYFYSRFTSIRKISLASTLHGNHYFNEICTDTTIGCNYILHYSQSPFWKLQRLEHIASHYGKKWWNEKMDCKSIIDDNGKIMLWPHKSKKVLKIENEILKQLESYGQDIY